MENLVQDSTQVIAGLQNKVKDARKQSAKTSGKLFDSEMNAYMQEGVFDWVKYAINRKDKPLSGSIDPSIGSSGSDYEFSQSIEDFEISFTQLPTNPNEVAKFKAPNGKVYSFSRTSETAKSILAMSCGNFIKTDTSYVFKLVAATPDIVTHLRTKTDMEKAYQKMIEAAITKASIANPIVAPQVDELGN